MKYLPPNIFDFDSVHDGTASMSRARGRAGPSQTVPASALSSAAEQAMSLVSTFFTAQAKASVPPPAVPPVPQISRPQVSLVTLPLPTPAAELPRFLEDFWQVKWIDIIGHSAAFEAAALSPDLFPHLTIARITEIMLKPI